MYNLYVCLQTPGYDLSWEFVYGSLCWRIFSYFTIIVLYFIFLNGYLTLILSLIIIFYLTFILSLINIFYLILFWLLIFFLYIDELFALDIKQTTFHPLLKIINEIYVLIILLLLCNEALYKHNVQRNWACGEF